MERFLEYIRSIGIDSNVLISKVEQTLQAALKMCPEDVIDIFVSDVISGDGVRSYQHLYFFTDNFIIESANFSTDPSISIEVTVLKDRVKYILAKFKDYSGMYNDNSRLSIDCRTDAAYFQFRGARNNCESLVKIYDKYIRSNICQIPSSTMMGGSFLESE